MFTGQNKVLWLVSVLVISIVIVANGYQYLTAKNQDLSNANNVVSTPYGTIYKTNN